MPALKRYSKEEVAQHCSLGDLWISIGAEIYDLSRFSKQHPGGEAVLLSRDIAGQDATNAFYSLHRAEVLKRPQYSRLRIGTLEDGSPLAPGVPHTRSEVPYAEPSWLQGFKSPYFKESHYRFQTAFRQFVEDTVFPDAQMHEEDGKPPSRHVFEEMARLNVIAMRLGPGKHLQGLMLMNGIVKPEEFDCFHEMIMALELSRIHARGYSDGLGGGTCIGLPPVLNYGSKELQAKIVPEVLTGKKFICLAVSEAFAGSDVAGIKCSAARTEGGWVVNGTKKWITNGTFADYFTVGCRTEADGLVVVLVPRGEGVKTTLIRTSYSTAAGTAYVTFDNVKVPYGNTLGEENGGLQVILSNFNHERWGLTCGSVGAQRVILEECLKWVTQRQVFGKPLSSQAVVRSKLANIISRVETCQAWLDSTTYQMTQMNYKEQATLLAGQIAFLKMFSTRSGQETARDAIQIFGGRGLTQSGMGKFVEHYHRTLLIDAVGGGAEDVMGDLGVRQALKRIPRGVRL